MLRIRLTVAPRGKAYESWLRVDASSWVMQSRRLGDTLILNYDHVSSISPIHLLIITVQEVVALVGLQNSTGLGRKC
ncbi:hypothetical protein EAF00_010001 [Botryotinia globosa]|nr:hypothetical protein EAF00_010001 [Botryotinia globosa]